MIGYVAATGAQRTSPEQQSRLPQPLLAPTRSNSVGDATIRPSSTVVQLTVPESSLTPLPYRLRPVVSVAVPIDMESGRIYTITITLSNSSPKPGAAFRIGAGVHVRLINGLIVSGRAEDFDSVHAFNEDSVEIPLFEASIIEFYQADFPGNRASKASFQVRPMGGRGIPVGRSISRMDLRPN